MIRHGSLPSCRRCMLAVAMCGTSLSFLGAPLPPAFLHCPACRRPPPWNRCVCSCVWCICAALVPAISAASPATTTQPHGQPRTSPPFRAQANVDTNENNPRAGSDGTTAADSAPASLHVACAGPATMFSELFEHRPELNVLLCRQCNYAVAYSGLDLHLRRSHHFRTSEIIALLQHAPVEAAGCNGPHTANHPANGGPPIPGLRPPVDGVVCRECGYACTNMDSMRRHVKERHPTSYVPNGAGPRLWEPAQMQMLYAGTHNVRYFTVVPGAATRPSVAALPSLQAPPAPEQASVCVCVPERG
jgi:Orsellinic acid/F9775 biosynthesis cluster protein D